MQTLEIAQRPSPNCGPRRAGLKPQLIVIHYTAMDNAEVAIQRLCDPVAEVSAHYLIANNGAITGLVPEDQRAWHAGAGSWQGQDDVNSRSIGIELDNRGTHPFSEPQMSALEGLLAQVIQRWSIPATGVIGHSDMAPGRKMDPGPHFDWARLARLGLAADVCRQRVPLSLDPDSFMRTAQAAGYPVDLPFETLLAATRLRFAPWRRGPLVPADYNLQA
ncbi:N-acetylmuramoyl-L-alanine amidase [Sulfitobacter sp. F26204]|uniref:N-acetylmuramoyl-L-alanine amidase n=1 Tax=Sulfitobacter sp. F26204 TaxID=2996014 RepID=UPI00225DD837|nr:N-acetylmuramoyl-L-alanine amidase [Sulfitobacter sp. F26204]MCX7559080.1 N-acetylmuramoyl-L-alanine amidase [Sulfitobacter sp. F26204]